MSLSTSASSRRRNLSCKAWIRKRLVSTPRSAVINNSSSSSRSSASTTLRPLKSRSRPPLRASRVRLNRCRRRRNIPRRSAASGTSPVSSRSSASGIPEPPPPSRLPVEVRLTRLGGGGDGRRVPARGAGAGVDGNGLGLGCASANVMGLRPPAATPGASGAETAALGAGVGLGLGSAASGASARTRRTLLPGGRQSQAASGLGSVSSTRGAVPFSPSWSVSLPLRRNQRRISMTS